MANIWTNRWVLKGQKGLDSLDYQKGVQVPEPGPDEVLVELYAASLNYRELVITKGGSGPATPDIVPSSDGAGIVLSVGKGVKGFKEGDKVVTYLAPGVADNDAWPTFKEITEGLGQQVNGTLTQYGIFPVKGLVHMPNGIGFPEASTLTCSALTAWNALFGLKGREVKKGDWVLTQGTGGVSIAALQFAIAAGANVVATTSSDEKAKRLQDLGARHVINYREKPDWSQAAKIFTPGSRGVDIVVDVGGENTLGESVKAVRQDGLVVAAGLVGGAAEEEKPSIMDVLWNLCIVRGVLLGTRNMFKDMNKFVEENKVKLAVDDEVFELTGAKEAYEKLEAQKHFAKVIIKIK